MEKDQAPCPVVYYGMHCVLPMVSAQGGTRMKGRGGVCNIRGGELHFSFLYFFTGQNNRWLAALEVLCITLIPQ